MISAPRHGERCDSLAGFKGFVDPARGYHRFNGKAVKMVVGWVLVGKTWASGAT